MEVVIQRRASQATEPFHSTELQKLFTRVPISIDGIDFFTRIPDEYAGLTKEEKLKATKTGPLVTITSDFWEYMLDGQPVDELLASNHYKIWLYRPRQAMSKEDCISFMDEIGALQTGAEGICFLLFQFRIMLCLNEEVRRSHLASPVSDMRKRNSGGHPKAKHDSKNLVWELNMSPESDPIGPESLLVCYLPI